MAWDREKKQIQPFQVLTTRKRKVAWASPPAILPSLAHQPQAPEGPSPTCHAPGGPVPQPTGSRGPIPYPLGSRGPVPQPTGSGGPIPYSLGSRGPSPVPQAPEAQRQAGGTLPGTGSMAASSSCSIPPPGAKWDGGGASFLHHCYHERSVPGAPQPAPQQTSLLSLARIMCRHHRQLLGRLGEQVSGERESGVTQPGPALSPKPCPPFCPNPGGGCRGDPGAGVSVRL